MRNAMLNKTPWFSLILGLTSVALAQDRVQPNLATKRVKAVSPQGTQSCQVTYSSGTFNTGTQFCITVNGNIPIFTVRGFELFAPAGKHYYDYAASDSCGWNASILKQSGNTVTVTRTTADGNRQLTQTIVNAPATAGAVGSAKVTMKLQNLSGVGRFASLLRFADEDVPGGNNSYNATQYSASGQFKFGAGLMITVNKFPSGFGQEAFVQNTQSGPDPCSPLASADSSLPYKGLSSIIALWQTGNTKKIAPGAVATVTSIYRGF
jgi:hypothetical protein